MTCDIYAWVDYDETVVSAWGEPHIMTHTMAALDDFFDYVVYDLLAGVRPGVIDEVLEFAREADPAGVERWFREHPEPIVRRAPKGLPERLGFKVLNDLLLYFNYAPPDPTRPGEVEARGFRWPPEESVNHHSFSWLSAAELAEVADQYALIPQVDNLYVDGAWRRIVGDRFQPGGGTVGLPRQVSYGHRHDELDATVAMMQRLNGNDPNRSRLVFWFDN